MSDLLFDTPFWLPILILAAGVGLFVFGNNRSNSRVRTGGVAIVLLAVGLCVVSYFVQTPKERAITNTKAIVFAFRDSDWPAFQSHLPERISLGLLNFPQSIYNSRDDLVAGAKNAQEKYKVKSVVITSIDATQADTVITVNLDALTEQEYTMGRPIPSSWQFDWQESANGWVLTTITALKVANQGVDQVRPMFPAAAK